MRNKYILVAAVLVLSVLLGAGQVSGFNKRILSLFDFNSKTRDVVDKDTPKTRTIDKRVLSDGISKVNEKITVKYQKTTDSSSVHYDVYVDDKGSSYTFVDDKLTGYLRNRKVAKETVKRNMISKKEVESKARKLGSKILKQFGKNIGQYRSGGVDYNKSYNEYSISFIRYINGYATNESFSVSFGGDGRLENFSTHHIGKYDKIKVNIDKGELVKYIESSVKKEYPKASYKIESQFINYINNGFYLQIDVAIDDAGINKSTQLLYPIE